MKTSRSSFWTPLSIAACCLMASPPAKAYTAPAPTLTSVSPATGRQGAIVPVTLTGTNFVSSATVATNNTGIAVSAVTVVSTTQNYGHIEHRR
jgi:hypothetical protein